MNNSKDSIKVVVLGNKGVGKTSLIHQLMNQHNNSDTPTCGSSNSTPNCASKKSLNTMFNASSSECTAPTASTENSSHSVSSTTTQDPLVALDVYDLDLPHASDGSGGGGLRRLTIWDFSGQEQFHAAQEMFFTHETLYIVVWDMAAHELPPLEQERCCGNGNTEFVLSSSSSSPPNPTSLASQARCTSSCSSAFRLDYDSDSDSDCELDLYNQEEVRSFKRALDKDIDEKVQEWIDRIQARVPGATILPVATFADRFWTMDQCKESKKRCKSLKERLLCNENCRYQDLKWRIESESSNDGRGHKGTCRWVHSLNRRPQILFGSAQDDGQLLSHQVCSQDGMGMACLRDFVFHTARALAHSPQGPALQHSPETRSVLRDTCRSMKKHFKIVQASYFLQQYSTASQQEIPSALESLHRSGELCFFRCQAGETNADLVILDPAWMVESVNFVLRNGVNRFGSSSLLSELDDSLCQSFKEEMRFLWTNRPRTKLGLELAVQVSADAAVHAFDFLASLLAQFDILVPLSFGKGNKDVFMPSRLAPRDFHEDCDSSCSVNCPLLHLGAANVFSRSICHGLTFMDRAPESLMEKISIHVMKTLDSSSFGALEFQEIHCWKDSWRIKVVGTGEVEERSMEIQFFLLHAPDNDVTASHVVSCKSMCITCIEVSRGTNSLSDEERQVCRAIRRGLQDALNEIPGIDFRDEGVCPDCLKNKPVGEIGTWTFTKIRNSLKDQDTTVRCRNGHCVDVALVKSLITCNLDKPKPDFSCCIPATKTLLIGSSVGCPGEVANSTASSQSTIAGSRSLSEHLCTIKPCDNLRRSNTVPSTVGSSIASGNDDEHLPSASVSTASSTIDVDEEKNQEVKKIIEAYETSTKKRFFGMKKQKLNLSDLQLRETNLPIADLIGTSLGQTVQHLSLSNNLFETLPPLVVVSLPNLKSLDLSNCCISSLPQKWDMPKLKKLNLSHNELSSFPCEEMLSGMPDLEELNLSGNKIKSVKISGSTQILSKLKTLDLSNNRINLPPKDLERLPSLKLFDIQGNPLKEVPVGIVSSMNSFLVESVDEMKPKGTKHGRSDKLRQRKSMWRAKRSSSSDDSSTDHVKRLNRRSAPKHIALSRSTQNTIPIEDSSERCERSIY